MLRKLLETELNSFGQNPQAATKLLGVGESARDKRLNPAELAAWTTVTSVILNLDETVTRRSTFGVSNSADMTIHRDIDLHLTRRQLFGLTARGIGAAALGSLLTPDLLAAGRRSRTLAIRRPVVSPAFRTSRRRRSASSSCTSPAGRRSSRRSTTSRASRSTRARRSPTRSARASASPRRWGRRCCRWRSRRSQFAQHGQSGHVGERAAAAHREDRRRHLPHQVDAHRGDQSRSRPSRSFRPAFQQPGRPSMGAWVSYGLGSENQNLPAFVVLLVAGARAHYGSAALLAALGERISAVELSGRQVPRRRRSGAVPARSRRASAGRRRRQMLDAARQAQPMQHEAYGDPEIETRIAQYEMAYRMQTSVPELTDLSKEPESVFELYGPTSRKPGTYAANCLLARRLAERGVRFIQLYHRGWDQHGNLPRDIALQCKGTDQPTAALHQDLKQRGLLDDTLVIWGGEFGRTVFSQGKLTDVNYGRDHHPRNFTMWMAGGGIKRGFVLGETDDFSYNIVVRSGLRPRSAGHDAAPAGHRPHEADLPLPGPRLPPDRRARRGGAADPGVGPSGSPQK